MANLILDPKDQKFVLHDMLQVEKLCDTPPFNHLSQKTIDMSLAAARELAERELYPTISEGDRQGCRLENGEVRVPSCFQRLKKIYDEGGWPALQCTREFGGQGYPLSVWLPLVEWFMPNGAFMWLMNKPFSGTTLIEMFGSPEQKKRYLPDLIAGRWGSVVAANDDDSGCDVSMQTATAVQDADGTYRIQGIKGHVTSGETDLFDNLIHLVLARIEGDPPDQPSLFIVPAFRVGEDGSVGPKNDCTVAELQDKMGFKGTPTCRVSYGDRGNCQAELLGEPRQAMAMVLPLLLNGYLCCGIQATAAASAAYRHALDHARRRKQGAALQEAENPQAPRVPIIAHPDVRRMLLSMKSQSEGMRALLYFTGLCVDKATSPSNETNQWAALRDMLMPLCRIYSADTAFRVCETSIQVHGRYGYFKGTLVEQLIRDVKAQSIWELTTGLHALIFISQTMPRNEGRDFAALLEFMHKTAAEYEGLEAITDLSAEIQKGLGLLGATAQFMGACAQADKLLVPISNAVPFMQCMGTVVVGWLLYWQAGVAAQKLAALFRENDIAPTDAQQKSQFLSSHKQAAFLDGKIHSARYYLKNILPQANALATAIETEDLSILAISDGGF